MRDITELTDSDARECARWWVKVAPSLSALRAVEEWTAHKSITLKPNDYQSHRVAAERFIALVNSLRAGDSRCR